MSRNKYTHEANAKARKEIERRAKDLKKLEASIHRGEDGPILPVMNEDKLQRGIRRAHNEKHKPTRFRSGNEQSS
ncbi:hypothetical protein [Saccharothrix deserti]|uniref:hypothetical protein n=1 Tax=Saccharothrix deserti TaxID=2593674 RepID=UPI00131A9ABF|nr:hypothetical protein [Saccharothrix deserti]